MYNFILGCFGLILPSKHFPIELKALIIICDGLVMFFIYHLFNHSPVVRYLLFATSWYINLCSSDHFHRSDYAVPEMGIF